MNEEELTPHFEELKRVLDNKISDEELRKELDIYLNTYRVPIDAAKRGIMRKYDVGEISSFVTSNTISKKVKDLQGTEMNVDITAKAVYVDKKEISVRGQPKIIVSGILGDETGTAPFTIWEGENVELIKNEVYIFKNAYTKKWNERIQINLSSRGKIEHVANVVVEVTNELVATEPSELKIGDIKEGVGNVTVTGRILSVAPKDITVKGEQKVVYSGLIADNTGKIQFSAWNDYDLKDGESICIKNGYIRAWRGIPQLNLGDKCEITRVEDSFGDISDNIIKKTIGDIVKVGGALDVSITGTVVDVRSGSGLIKRCPECNRSVLNNECTTHGIVEPISDLRMKLILDDGTGAISAIINRHDTEKITEITLEAAEGLAKARGDSDIISKEMSQRIILKQLTVTGNVMSDDYGSMMIVRESEINEIDIHAEAENLYKELEETI